MGESRGGARMNRMDNYVLEKETLKEQQKAGRYHPSTVIIFRKGKKKYRHVLGCGTSDYLKVFRDGYLVIVLTWNVGLDYCGVDVFENEEKVGEFFTGSPDETLQLKRRWEEYDPVNLAKALMQYVSFD